MSLGENLTCLIFSVRGKVLLVVSTDWDECLLEPVALALELAQKSGLRLTLFPSHPWGHWKSGPSIPISYVSDM